MKISIVSRQAHEMEIHDGRFQKPKSYEVGMQISRGVHTEVPQEDAERGAEKMSWRGISLIGGTEGESDRGRSSGVRSRAYDDRDTAEVFGVAGSRVYQGQECDPLGTGVRGEEAQLCGEAILGKKVLRFQGWPRRNGDPGVNQESGARR